MSFEDQIKKWTKKAEGNAEKVFRGTSLSLFAKVILRTPVGNPSLWKGKPPEGYTGGRLRGNWQASINRPTTGTVDDIDAQGSSTIGKASWKVSGAKLGDSVWLTNNLPYAVKVESGHHSKQAPAGMVKVTVTEFKREVARQARKVK